MPSKFAKFISARAADEIPNLQYHAVPASPVTMPHKVARASSKVRIFVGLLDRALGEVIIKNLFAAAVHCQFDDAFTTVYFHQDRPYKSDIVNLNPHVSKTLMAGPGFELPIEYFYGFGDRAPVPGADDFIKRGLAFPDLLITPSMVDATDPMRFDYLPYLGIPRALQAELDQRLVDLGLDPNCWFCCLYYREKGSRGRNRIARRDVNSEPFMRLCEWIIKDLGGQVVRIGDPGMTPFPDLPGFVDLSRLEDQFLLQANSVARARFGVVTSSGPAALFGAFGIPHCISNAIGFSTNWRETDFVLPRHFRGPNGDLFDVSDAVSGGYWNEFTVENMLQQGGYTPIDNSPEELKAAANILHGQTDDTTGWRAHRDVLAHAAQYKNRPNQHVLNAPIRKSVSIRQFPDRTPWALS
jgi:putative glycosyltransferase (TIGR04372 family)